jgi:DNA modification methylase
MSKHQLKTSVIYCGDNLEMLKEIPDESVDLIYIDPPFNSNRKYEVFWNETQEKRAFEDRFGDAQTYIGWMRPRILELYRVLKPTGTFYYHCDWHASHYVKVLLDQIFNFNNFQGDIVWNYRLYSQAAVKGKRFEATHDTILAYTKSQDYTFNPVFIDVKIPIEEAKNYGFKQDQKGWFKTAPTGLGKGGYSQETVDKMDKEGLIYWTKNNLARKKYYVPTDGKSLLDKHVIGNVWSDIPDMMHAKGTEKLGYPTQKPVALLKRIIEASSNKGDIILDAFCGCGTSLIASQTLGRKWVGIDVSPTACRVMAQRLWDNFKLNEGKDFELSDMPKSAKDLMQLPPFEFQNWAVIALGGIPNQVKVGDYGIDGKLYPIEQEKSKEEGRDLFGDMDIYYPIQVKQKDKAGRPDIDSFETAIRRDKRNKGYFVSFGFTEDAVKEMRRLDKEGEIEIIPITVDDLLKHESQIKLKTVI